MSQGHAHAQERAGCATPHAVPAIGAPQRVRALAVFGVAIGDVTDFDVNGLNASVAQRARPGELSLTQAVQAGLFQPVGQGDARIEEIIRALDTAGYERWRVPKKDTAITGEEPPVRSGPVVDVGRSIDYLMALAPHTERVLSK